MGTTDPPGRSGILKRIAWFAVFWLGGVAAVTALAYAIRSVLL